MQTLEKTTVESVLYDIDCSALLAPGETISSVMSLVAEPVTTPPIAFGLPAINAQAQTYTDLFGSKRTAPIGQVVQVQIGGGYIRMWAQVQIYRIRCRFATSLNPLVEAVVRLRVKD